MTRHQNQDDAHRTLGHLPSGAGASVHRARVRAVSRVAPLLKAGAVASALALAVSGGAWAAVLNADRGGAPLTEAQARLAAASGTETTAEALNVSAAQVAIETVTEDVTDPYTTVEQESSSLAEGTTEVQTAGVDGVVRTTYQVVTENGVEVSREAVSSVVVTPRTDEVVLVGTASGASSSSDSSSSSSSGSASSGSSGAATTTTAVNDGSVWWSLAMCESGGNAGTNTGNGYYGAFQFSLSTWQSLGGTGYPHEHSYEEQLAMAQTLQARAGWGQWPHCAAQLGLL